MLKSSIILTSLQVMSPSIPSHATMPLSQTRILLAGLQGRLVPAPFVSIMSQLPRMLHLLPSFQDSRSPFLSVSGCNPKISSASSQSEMPLIWHLKIKASFFPHVQLAIAPLRCQSARTGSMYSTVGGPLVKLFLAGKAFF